MLMEYSRQDTSVYKIEKLLQFLNLTKKTNLIMGIGDPIALWTSEGWDVIQ